MTGGELEKRSMTLDYIKDCDEHLILDGTERFVEIGNIKLAKKYFPMKNEDGSYNWNSSKSKKGNILFDVITWYEYWFGDSSDVDESDEYEPEKGAEKRIIEKGDSKIGKWIKKQFGDSE